MSNTYKSAKANRANEPDIIITVHDQLGRSVVFRIKCRSLLSKLQDAYACKMGVDVNSLKFLYGGQRIRVGATPECLKMCDEDVIDVAMEHIGG